MDSVIRSRIHWSPHDEVLTHITDQPTEGLILQRNKELRDHDLLGDLSFGRQVACIPFSIWEEAQRMGFDVANPDGEFAGKEINRFLQTPKGQLCLTREKKHKYFKGGY